jgi:thiol-disulfide isomerase/thioredoxin
MDEEFPTAPYTIDGHPPTPKARFFDKRFWTGFAFGAVTGFIVLVGGLFVLGLMIQAHMARTMSKGAEKGGAAYGLPAPEFPGAATAEYNLKLEGLDGAPFDADTLKGKVVFLNFWATWCGPCRAEMPSIQTLYDKAKGQGVVFLAVSDEKREAIAEFVKKNPYTFPVYRIVGATPEVFRSAAIPTTFILAPDGRVAFKHVGSAQWDTDSTLAFLKTLSPSAP